MTQDLLLQLAAAAGIQLRWTDARGRQQAASPGNLRNMLEAMDLPCASDSQCRESLARLAAESAVARLPPLLTARAGIATPLPAAALHGKRYRIELEQGGMLEGCFPADVALPLRIPAIECCGYHRLLADDREVLLAVAPARCFTVGDALFAAGASEDATENSTLWGLAAQLYGLRRAGDGGIGDFTALAALARSAARHGAGALAISPVHAMFSADLNRFSPYSPSSRLFLNVLHIDPAAVMGSDALQQAIAAAGTETAQALQQLEQRELMDWPQSAALKLRLLRLLYRQYHGHGSLPERDDFERFKAAGGQALIDHARYEAMSASVADCDWRCWDDDWRSPRQAAVEEFARQHAEEIEFHLFLQWQAARGLASAQQTARDSGMPVGLIADLAVGADIAGSQAWSRQEEMLLKLSIGAPPDMLNARGQNWGLGALSPRAMRTHGFRAWLEMLRAAFAHAGGIRIDHVLGLKRLWLVPHGGSPDQGAYLRYPLADLLRLVALESWRNQAIVIGEDLGTVPPGYSEQLSAAGLLGIRLLWFQRRKQDFLAPAEWSAGAIATTTTHDLPTVAGWWGGRDIAWRSKLDLLEQSGSAHKEQKQREKDRAALWKAFTAAGCASGEMPETVAPVAEALAFIGRTPAPLAIVPLEDALALPEQPNLPGTTAGHPNWCRRMPQTVERLLDDPQVAARLAALDRERRKQDEAE